METELEILKKRILKLENQVKKLSLNLPVSGSVNPYDLSAVAKEMIRMDKKRHCR